MIEEEGFQRDADAVKLLGWVRRGQLKTQEDCFTLVQMDKKRYCQFPNFNLLCLCLKYWFEFCVL